MAAPYRPRQLTLHDGRVVTLRAIATSDEAEIRQAFDRLSDDSRYSRFMTPMRELDPATLARGLRPVPGQDFTFVATVPAEDGFDIVGAARYLRSDPNDARCCEFAITLAEDWRGSGLAGQLMACLIRRARHDGYAEMEGFVIARNRPMLALAQRLGFRVERDPEDGTTVRVVRVLQVPAPGRQVGAIH